MHPPPLQLVSRQAQPGVKTAQCVIILLNIVIRNNRALRPGQALPLLVNAIIARRGGMRKQAIEVERARLEVQRPVRLITQHDAAVTGNGAAVSRYAQLLEAELFSLFDPAGLHAGLAANPFGGKFHSAKLPVQL